MCSRLLSAGLLIAALGGSGAAAQAPPPAHITFHFVRPGMAVPEYSFAVRQDGSGTYTATVAQLPDGHSFAQPAQVPTTTTFSASFSLPPAKTATLFGLVRDAGYLRKDCASHAKNIADTGAKTLTYSGPQGSTRCVYNYSTEKPIAALTEAFQGMSFTLESGRLMEHEERYDRLGLDREMNSLVDALKDGRANAPELIAPELRSLVNDEQVMQRVRRNATILLDQGSLEH